MLVVGCWLMYTVVRGDAIAIALLIAMAVVSCEMVVYSKVEVMVGNN